MTYVMQSKTVQVPHLGYTVRFRPFKKPPPRLEKAKAWVKRDDRHSCTVYSPNGCTPSALAHELVHVLYFICQDRYMSFEEEFEHMAYLMQYLMGSAYGLVYAKT